MKNKMFSFKLYCSCIIIILLSVIIFFIDPVTYNLLVQEDGLVEYISAFSLLACSMILFHSIYKRWANLKLSQTIGLALMSFILFFGFGEEVSWGQRIFGIISPDFFVENNLQNETNIHNLKLYGIKLNQWVFTYVLVGLCTMYFLALPLVVRFYTHINHCVSNYAIPIPKWEYSLVFLIASLALNLINIPRIAELWECVFSITLLIVCTKPYELSDDRENCNYSR